MLQIIILKTLENAPTHAAQLYRHILNMTEDYEISPNRSRTYVYKTIDELCEQEFITFEKSGRKKIYHLNEKGKKYLHAYEDNFFNTIQKLVIIIEQMKETIAGKHPTYYKVEITDAEKNYISKIINVKLFIQWYVLHRLIYEGPFYGGILYRELETWFGWLINHSYFYKVLREMDNDGLIRGYWMDDETRSKREYQATDAGKNEYEFIQCQLETYLSNVKQFLRSIIYLIHPIHKKS